MNHAFQNSYSNFLGEKYGYIFLVYFIIFTSVIFYNFTDAESIPDYYSYLQIIDSIYYFYDPSQIYYEPASTLLLYTSRLITGDAISAVSLARYFITSLFVIFFYILGKYKKVPLLSLVFILSVFGPLIIFVTIRATPAYMLVAIAALDAKEGRVRAMLWAFLALQFHVSVILAFPPIILSLIQNRTNYFSFIEKSMNGVIAFFGVIGLIFIIFGQSFSNLLLQAVGQIGFLMKYVAYVGVLDQNNANYVATEAGSQTYHRIYLGAASMFFLFFIFLKDRDCIKFRSYTIVSFVIFLFMQFSPVTAFRYSIYWMIPGLLLVPWSSYLKPPVIRIATIVMCLGAFIFQLSKITI